MFFYDRCMLRIDGMSEFEPEQIETLFSEKTPNAKVIERLANLISPFHVSEQELAYA